MIQALRTNPENDWNISNWNTEVTIKNKEYLKMPLPSHPTTPTLWNIPVVSLAELVTPKEQSTDIGRHLTTLRCAERLVMSWMVLRRCMLPCQAKTNMVLGNYSVSCFPLQNQKMRAWRRLARSSSPLLIAPDSTVPRDLAHGWFLHTV